MEIKTAVDSRGAAEAIDLDPDLRHGVGDAILDVDGPQAASSLSRGGRRRLRCMDGKRRAGKSRNLGSPGGVRGREIGFLLTLSKAEHEPRSPNASGVELLAEKIEKRDGDRGIFHPEIPLHVAVA